MAGICLVALVVVAVVAATRPSNQATEVQSPLLGREAPTLAASRPANEYGAYSGSMSNHDKVYDELVKALRQESYDLASAVEAEQTVLLIEKIKQWQSTSSI